MTGIRQTTRDHVLCNNLISDPQLQRMIVSPYEKAMVDSHLIGTPRNKTPAKLPILSQINRLTFNQ
jgi:hypothetical protein